jgi:hypothetical protein
MNAIFSITNSNILLFDDDAKIFVILTFEYIILLTNDLNNFNEWFTLSYRYLFRN